MLFRSLTFDPTARGSPGDDRGEVVELVPTCAAEVMELVPAGSAELDGAQFAGRSAGEDTALVHAQRVGARGVCTLIASADGANISIESWQRQDELQWTRNAESVHTGEFSA
mgnify:CR=1 FL=1